MFHALAALAVSIPLVFFNLVPTSWNGEINGPLCHAPVAVDDAYELWQGETLVVDAPGVLTNDTDQDNLPLTANQVSGSGPAHGTLILNLDGSFTYTPDAGFSGVDSFSYEAKNMYLLYPDSAVVTLTVKPMFYVYLPNVLR